MGYTPHVLVLGGGVTGTAVARDLAIRGLDVTLVERGRLTDGATGRMQGLLYSGARYADADPAIAEQSYAENRTLTEIADHCVEETGGLLVPTDSDGEAFESLVESCRDHDIPVEELSGEEVRELEPALGDGVDRGLRVPDATVDPFRLTVATAKSAIDFGAEIRTHTEVTEIHVEDGSVAAVTVEHDPEPTGRPIDVADDEDETEDSETADEAETEADSETADEDGTDVEGEAAEESDEDDEAAADDESEAADEAETADEEEMEDDSGTADEPETVDDSGDSDGDDGGTDAVPDGGKQVPGSTGGPGAVPPGESGVPGMPGTTGDEGPSRPTGSTERLEPDYVVNATGAWADEVAQLAGFSFPMARMRSAMVVTEEQPVGMPVSTIGTDGSDRTAVPHGQHCVLGATAEPTDDPDDLQGDGAEADRLLADLSGIVPDFEGSRVLRTFWGVRSGPPKGDREGRRFALVDHAERDGCWGMTTVVGGTLTTHRLVAERVADHVCGKFGISRECRTDELTLPGSEDQEVLDAVMDTFGLSSPVYERSRERLGSRTAEVLSTDDPNPVLCESESVTRAEIRDALADESASEVDLNDVRIRTSATMGSCQGGRCAHRIAAELYPEYELDVVGDALDDLLAERWRGQRHAPWGAQLAQAARNYELHARTLGRKHPVRGGETLDLEGFDDGPTAGSDQPAAGWGMRR